MVRALFSEGSSTIKLVINYITIYLLIFIYLIIFIQINRDREATLGLGGHISHLILGGRRAQNTFS